MTRWLLNTFPTWAIGAIVIGIFVAAALGGLWAVRRLMPEAHEGGGNDFAGAMASVIAAVYGVFLAIAIVSLYEQSHEAEQDVRAEASALARIARAGDALAPPARERVRAAVAGYRDEVVGAEWRAMEDGDHSASAWDRLDSIYAALRDHEPRGEAESAFYGEAVGAVGDLVEVRRARLHAGEASLPTAFNVLLFGGAFLTLGFTLVFGVRSRRMHAALAVGLGALLGLSLLVAIILDHPFSGDVSVSQEPYFEGALEAL